MCLEKKEEKHKVITIIRFLGVNIDAFTYFRNHIDDLMGKKQYIVLNSLN